jgi:hypothetical protein
MSNSLEQLRKLILSQKKEAVSQRPRLFLPENSLDQILQQANILETLRDPSFHVRHHKLENTVDFVSKDGRKIFAILIELGLEHALTRFIEHEILDSALPLSEQELEPILESHSGRFIQCQWDYLAHRFSKRAYHRKLSAECILPYVDQTKIGDGGFSTVYDVLVHPAHQDIDPEVKGTV